MSHPTAPSWAPRPLTFPASIALGDFVLTPGSRPDRVLIHRTDGEGGEFDRQQLTDALTRALDAFYADHF